MHRTFRNHQFLWLELQRTNLARLNIFTIWNLRLSTHPYFVFYTLITTITSTDAGQLSYKYTFILSYFYCYFDIHHTLAEYVHRVADLLLVLIELFSLGVMPDALRAKIDRKLAISFQRGHFDSKFQVEGVAPLQAFLHG